MGLLVLFYRHTGVAAHIVRGCFGCFVVILESCSPGSAVIKIEENDRFWTEAFQNDPHFINGKIQERSALARISNVLYFIIAESFGAGPIINLCVKRRVIVIIFYVFCVYFD